MAQLCFGVIFFSPRRHSCVFFSRLFAELLRELLARLDDEPRERALLLARARGVTPRYPPVLMFHVFLSCIQRGVEVSVRSSLEIEVLRDHETGAGQKAVEKVGKSTWTNLRDGDELPHVPHPLRPGQPPLPEQLPERRRVQRRAAVRAPRLLVLAQRAQQKVLRAVAMKGVAARVQDQHAVLARARERERVEADGAHLRAVDPRPCPAARHGDASKRSASSTSYLDRDVEDLEG